MSDLRPIQTDPLPNAPGSPPGRKAAWLRTKPWFLRVGVGMSLVGAVGLLANWLAT